MQCAMNDTARKDSAETPNCDSLHARTFTSAEGGARLVPVGAALP